MEGGVSKRTFRVGMSWAAAGSVEYMDSDKAILWFGICGGCRCSCDEEFELCPALYQVSTWSPNMRPFSRLSSLDNSGKKEQWYGASVDPGWLLELASGIGDPMTSLEGGAFDDPPIAVSLGESRAFPLTPAQSRTNAGMLTRIRPPPT